MRKVAIIGIGALKARPKSPELSYKEMTYQAAKLAYQDAGIDPQELQSFVTLAEDIHEGTSIFDEYTPDQLGSAQKPMHTITHDGLVGLADAAMQIASGLFDLVVVEAHSKASNIKNKADIEAYALDPNWVRPLGIPAHALAALEAACYIKESGVTEEALAEVVSKNKGNAKSNHLAAYPKSVTLKDFRGSTSRCSPLRDIETAHHADGACVIVLAGEERAKANGAIPVWIQGFGWATETSAIDSKTWDKAVYATAAAKKAFRMAGIADPQKEISLLEIDDTYAFKELQHLEAIWIFERQSAWKKTLEGATAIKGKIPVNASGGCLGMGEMLEAKGLYQVHELVTQLRGKAGKRQVENAKRGVALAWRGVPTSSGACLVLGRQPQ
ncbi:MAG: acetyl-CoA acetyltransferase [Elusimicrobia bacterium]|nr:acetyl-CoA acetyltransferase [Elusimicrobiota bacterium]